MLFLFFLFCFLCILNSKNSFPRPLSQPEQCRVALKDEEEDGERRAMIPAFRCFASLHSFLFDSSAGNTWSQNSLESQGWPFSLFFASYSRCITFKARTFFIVEEHFTALLMRLHLLLLLRRSSSWALFSFYVMWYSRLAFSTARSFSCWRCSVVRWLALNFSFFSGCRLHNRRRCWCRVTWCLHVLF